MKVMIRKVLVYIYICHFAKVYVRFVDVIKELESFNIAVDVVDPMASPEEVRREYDLDLVATPKPNGYDAVIVAVNHKPYRDFQEVDFESLMRDDKGVLVDLKGLFRNHIERLAYWSL